MRRIATTAALIALSLLGCSSDDSYSESEFSEGLQEEAGLDEETADCIAAEVFADREGEDVSESDFFDDGEMTDEAAELIGGAVVTCSGVEE